MIRDPVLFLVRQGVAQDRVAEIALVQPGEIENVVVEHFIQGGVDVVDQIRSFLVRDQIIGGRTDLFDRREIAFHHHADFQVEVDLPGTQVGFLLRNGIVFDDLEIDILLFAPLFQEVGRDRPGRDADRLSVQGRMIAGRDGCVVVQCIQIVVFVPHRLVRVQDHFGAFLRVAEVIEEIDLSREKLFHAVGKTVAGDILDIPSGVCSDHLDVVERVTGVRFVVLVDHHQSFEMGVRDPDDFVAAVIGAEKHPGQKEKQYAEKQDCPVEPDSGRFQMNRASHFQLKQSGLCSCDMRVLSKMQ